MFFKTFTNQERLVLLGLLADGEHSMDELSSRLGIKGPDITHHVAKLVELGLVDWRIDDGKHFFSLNTSRLEEMNKQVMHSIKIDLRASLPDGATYQVWERKILDNYIDGERVKTLPSGYKNGWWCSSGSRTISSQTGSIPKKRSMKSSAGTTKITVW